MMNINFYVKNMESFIILSVMLCDVRGLPDATYYTLTRQSSGNWGKHAKQHVEPLKLY